MTGIGAMPQVPGRCEEMARTFKDGFFSLQVEEVKGGRQRLLMRVHSIKPKPVADATFEVPAGYNQLRIPGLQ